LSVAKLAHKLPPGSDTLLWRRVLHIASAAWDFHQMAVGQLFSHILGAVWRVHGTVLSHQDERWGLDMGEYRRQVLRGKIGQSFQHYLLGGLGHLLNVPLMMG
jgi:hypothetical protein